MAPPTIAPPISPAATPAATPRCALAGVALSEPAIVATATKAANVFFIRTALLEVAPQAAPGLKSLENADTNRNSAASLQRVRQLVDKERLWGYLAQEK